MFRERVEITTLGNGLRVVTEPMSSIRSIAMGVFVGVGARDESAADSGLTHFIEHMLFKGTHRRTAREIAVAVESRGGMLNAFTDKEYTCYHARALAEDAPLVMDVISDMLTQPLLADEEVARERNVVLEEIRRYRDDPEEAVHDLLDSTMWPGHPLGRPVVGRSSTVKRFEAHRIRSFMDRYYEPSRIVVAAAGRIRHGAVVKLAERYFGAMPGRARRRPQVQPIPIAAESFKRKRIEQVQFCLGIPTFGHRDPRRYTVALIDMVLGGSMSSRLFQEIREKRGLVYDIGSHIIGYRDTGLFAVSGGAGPATFGQVLELIRQELQRIRKAGLEQDEIEQAKQRVRGVLVLSQESATARMMGVGKSLLLLDRVVPLDEVLAGIESVTNEMIRDVAGELFQPDRISLAAIGPLGREWAAA
ncbi:MAG: insulinase family protein [Chthonomonadales bacterium]|nr:insulinase family protein [Chthonomonadales bacterium]